MYKAMDKQPETNVPTISVQGWGLQRPSGSTEWKPRWLLIQHGSLLWFLDEGSQMPEDVVSLSASKYQRTGELLEKGEEVIALYCSSEDSSLKTVYIAVNSYESPLWMSTIKLHAEALESIDISAKEVLASTLEDYSDQVEPITGEVSFNKVPQYITCGIEDDTSQKVTEFLEQHAPKRVAQYHGTVENVVLKLLLESCVVFQEKQKRHMANLRRKLTAVVAAEQRAMHAEIHAENIGSSIAVMEKNVSMLTAGLDSAKSKSESRAKEVAQLSRLVEEAGASIKSLTDVKQTLVADKAALEDERETLTVRVQRSEELTAMYRAKAETLEKEMMTWKSGDGQTIIMLKNELQIALKELKDCKRQKALKDKALVEANDATQKAEQDKQMAMRDALLAKRESPTKGGADDIPASVIDATVGHVPPVVVASSGSGGGDRNWNEEFSKLSQAKGALKGKVQGLEETIKLKERQLDEMSRERASALEESERLTHELRQWQMAPMSSKLQAASNENKSLRAQVMKQHAEVVRLTGKLEEVRMAALDAVKVLHSLQPDSRVLEVLNKAFQSQPRMAPAPVFGSPLSPTTPGHGSLDTSSVVGSPGGLPLTAQMLSTTDSPAMKAREIPSSSAPMIAQRDAWSLENDVPYLDEIIKLPSVRLLIFHRLFERYASENQHIMHSRFIRFAKEYLLTPHASGASVSHVQPHLSPMLVAGDIDLIFKAAIRTDPEDKLAPFGTGPRLFVRRSQTSAASNMVFHQFIQGVSMLARKLYGHVVEERYGTALDYLPVDQREEVAEDLIILLVKGKILGGMARQSIVPFTHFFSERSLALVSMQTSTFEAIARNAVQLREMFGEFADVQAPGAENSVLDEPEYISFKALMRIAHTREVVPIMATENQLFAIFEEVLLIRRVHGMRLLTLMPSELVELCSREVAELSAEPPARKERQPRTAALGFPVSIPPHSLRSLHMEPHRGSLGPISFVFFLMIVSQQGDVRVAEDSRLFTLIERLVK